MKKENEGATSFFCIFQAKFFFWKSDHRSYAFGPPPPSPRHNKSSTPVYIYIYLNIWLDIYKKKYQNKLNYNVYSKISLLCVRFIYDLLFTNQSRFQGKYLTLPKKGKWDKSSQTWSRLWALTALTTDAFDRGKNLPFSNWTPFLINSELIIWLLLWRQNWTCQLYLHPNKSRLLLHSTFKRT